jgi:hypothetical protein
VFGYFKFLEELEEELVVGFIESFNQVDVESMSVSCDTGGVDPCLYLP